MRESKIYTCMVPVTYIQEFWSGMAREEAMEHVNSELFTAVTRDHRKLLIHHDHGNPHYEIAHQ